MEVTGLCEKWLPVIGYENSYRVSNAGRVYSLLANKILNPYVSNMGYLMVMLRGSDGKRKGQLVHRLVAMAFIENPDGFPVVNHKNENKLDNHADNLEWCTTAYNNLYSNVYNRGQSKRKKPVYRYDAGWGLIAKYASATEASKETGFSRGNIWNACQVPDRLRYNSHWSYTPLV